MTENSGKPEETYGACTIYGARATKTDSQKETENPTEVRSSTKDSYHSNEHRKVTEADHEDGETLSEVVVEGVLDGLAIGLGGLLGLGLFGLSGDEDI